MCTKQRFLESPSGAFDRRVNICGTSHCLVSEAHTQRCRCSSLTWLGTYLIDFCNGFVGVIGRTSTHDFTKNASKVTHRRGSCGTIGSLCWVLEMTMQQMEVSCGLGKCVGALGFNKPSNRAIVWHHGWSCPNAECQCTTCHNKEKASEWVCCCWRMHQATLTRQSCEL